MVVEDRRRNRMSPGGSALSHAHRIRAEAQRARVRSRSTRREGRALRAETCRARVWSRQLEARAPYARVVGTHAHKPSSTLVRRDGTVYGELAQARDALEATLSVARSCDRVESISFHRAGWRPGVPFVEASAQLRPGRPTEPTEETSTHDVLREVARTLDETVVRSVFEAGLAATSLLARSSEPSHRRYLDDLIAALDEALVGLRSVISRMEPVSRSSSLTSLSDFSMDEEELGDTRRLLLQGELDMTSAGDVEALLAEIAGSIVEVDLSSLTFIDARGMRALLEARHRIAEEGGTLRIVGATGMVRRAFALVDLDGILDN